MRNLAILMFFAFMSTNVLAVEPSHRDAVLQLLEITKTRELLEQNQSTVHEQLQSMVQTGIQQMTGPDFEISGEVKEELDLFILDVSEILREIVSYEAMEGPMIDMYAKAFSETELYQIIDFYKTPVGQLTIERMPIIMQEVNNLTQKQVMEIVPKIDQMSKEFVERVTSKQ